MAGYGFTYTSPIPPRGHIDWLFLLPGFGRHFCHGGRAFFPSSEIFYDFIYRDLMTLLHPIYPLNLAGLV